MKEKSVRTKHGEIALLTAGEAAPALLFLHGNSACKEVWRKQYESGLAARHRVIAMDLLGHGASDDAPDPEASYCMSGYAEAAIEILDALGIERVAVIGWSLGGHVAIEMIPRFPGLAGILLCGTPPVRGGEGENIAAGFHMNETTALAGKEAWSAEDAENFTRAALGGDASAPDWLLAAARRTDGRARRLMFESFIAGKGGDQSEILATTKVPTAIVNGADEPFINNEFVASAVYGNLWRERVHLLPDSGHAPFWRAAGEFNRILESFVADLH